MKKAPTSFNLLELLNFRQIFSASQIVCRTVNNNDANYYI